MALLDAGAKVKNKEHWRDQAKQHGANNFRLMM
jgi:hypothetical protein